MEVKLGAEIKTISEKMEDGQENIKAQVCSLAFRIAANQREMTAKMDASIEWTEACVRKLEANREKSKAVGEQQNVPKNDAAVCLATVLL
jgi:uncharacterized metal-binding protein YceD (DUF177 family)